MGLASVTWSGNDRVSSLLHDLLFAPMPAKPARILTFKCKVCAKPVQVFLQKVSACSHIQPYQGICKCGEVMRHATGQKDAVASYIAAGDGDWTHHH